jgi:hypothetical protein
MIVTHTPIEGLLVLEPKVTRAIEQMLAVHEAGKKRSST